MPRDLTLSNFNLFRFKKFNDEKFLLTNDIGCHIFIPAEIFEAFIKDPSSIPDELYAKLYESGFINSEKKHLDIINSFRKKYSFINEGPSLHIIVATLRCDHSCQYCHASRKSLSSKKYDMDEKTGEKVADFILKTTADNICMEFQGGEPLVNFRTIKHITEYAKKNKKGKNLIFSVVTNLSYMDDEKLEYFTDNNFSICTSLDGPEEIHNKLRILKNGNSYQNAVDWIKKINEENKKLADKNKKFNRINALLTTTRDCLEKYKEIVDLYIELGLSSVQFRPLNPFGYGKKLRESLLYTSAEFLEFYKKALDYMIMLNNQGINFYEKTAKIFLTKIINKADANYLDLRSPCGAGIGQLAYNYDGNIFTCDEGRMVYEMGDDIFLLGNVDSLKYEEAINNDVVRSLCIASCLEGIPGCNDCVYNPYCGVCPIYNYTEQGNIFGQMPTNDRCTINKGILDYLFSRINENFNMFSKWLDSN
jgi:uncharacterized protein